MSTAVVNTVCVDRLSTLRIRGYRVLSVIRKFYLTSLILIMCSNFDNYSTTSLEKLFTLANTHATSFKVVSNLRVPSYWSNHNFSSMFIGYHKVRNPRHRTFYCLHTQAFLNVCLFKVPAKNFKKLLCRCVCWLVRWFSEQNFERNFQTKYETIRASCSNSVDLVHLDSKVNKVMNSNPREFAELVR